MFDLIWVIFFGILGFLLQRVGFEPSPLIIGLVLGPELERGLTQGLIICNGSIWALITRPLAAAILSLGAIVILYNFVTWFTKLNNKRKGLDVN